MMTSASALSPASTEFGVAVLLPLAYGFAEEVYPDLLDKMVNHMPWWLPWWSPRSAATIRTVPRRRRRTRSERFFGWLGDGWRYFKRRVRQGFYGRISGIERQRYRWRKRLSALLSVLHDMGPGLASSLGDGNASGAEWRTAPLWNIGLTAGVSGGEAYLHDGRARTLDEAIRWHGGEGDASRQAYEDLTQAERDALIAFLKSL